jgi:UDPglucose 6-dehydrogenase
MANNTFRTMKISFGNMLGELAEELDADVGDILHAFETDPNTNSRYMMPASRYGGPCYARDNKAWQTLAESVHVAAPLAAATEETNTAHGRWLAEKVAKRTAPGGTVTILGMTYKPNAYLFKQSQGTAFADILGDEYQIDCYDPVGANDLAEHFDNINIHGSVRDAIASADTVTIATPWDEFKSPELYGSDVTLVDPWRLFRDEELPETVTYCPIGRR